MRSVAGAVTVLQDLIAAYPPSMVPCRGRDSGLWFSGHAGEQRTAMALCGSCPVMVRCRDTARAIHAGYGVWGGENAGQRRKAGYASVKT